jgi:methionyl-tRNA formyltransferase
VPRRLVYLGTPELAVPPLRALHEAGHDIALVVTQPDTRRGRGAATTPSPVKAAASELGIPVSDEVGDVVDVGAELGVVVAFGRLIKPAVLAAVPMVNVHFSLLPRWRGAAPVERALLAGDEITGVCIMDVAEALDTGAVYARAAVPIGAAVTAAELRSTLTEVGTRLLVDVLAGELPDPVPQAGEATYAHKISAGEWQLDWRQPAVVIDRWVRAGPAFTTFRDKRLRVLAGEPTTGAGQPGTLVDAASGEVATGHGGYRLLTVRPEGRGAMAWRDFANGAQPVAGEPLGAG